mmetsp:Transcript_33626/g.106764  ORF Transcript_33626/g.106764 Transcript_33626/m.106764 type:complete len:266 (-) Transcript_33626:645-1442(-)
MLDLVAKPRVLGCELCCAVARLLDLGFQGVLLLLLAVDAAREVGVLRLQLAHALVHACDLLLGLVLGLLRQRHGLFDLLVFLLQDRSLLLSLLALLLRQHTRVRLHGDLRLEVLRLPLKRQDLLVSRGILRLLLLELHLVEAQRVHEGVDFVGGLAATVVRVAVLVLQLLVGAFGRAQGLLERVGLDLQGLDGHLELAPGALEVRAALLVALEAIPQAVDVRADLLELLIQRCGLRLELLLTGLLLADARHVFEVLLLHNVQGLA